MEDGQRRFLLLGVQGTFPAAMYSKNTLIAPLITISFLSFCLLPFKAEGIMAGRVSQEQVDKVRLKAAQALERARKMERSLSQQGRKDDARRKIIAGALLFEWAKADPVIAARLKQAIDDIARPLDARVFEGWSLDDQ